jgi:glycerol-3-phosphate responsive antiterminator
VFNSNFEFVSHLQYRIKALDARVKAFESGEKYAAMRVDFKNQLSAKDREIRGLRKELADASRQTVTVRNNWSQMIDDLEKDRAKEIAGYRD